MALTYTLYTYFRSSCSARVRIAAQLKGIDLEYKFVHLLKGEQQAEEYGNLNPSGLLPTLVVTENGKTVTVIRQSVAILEYLEEARPELPSLLPPVSDPVARARVRELVNIIASDIQPVTNLRILQRIKSGGIDAQEWQQSFMSAGLLAYERLASSYAGKYSVGDNITLADCCLTPAVDGALRFGVQLDQFPNVSRINKELVDVEAFQKGSWKSQPDTPEEFRNPAN